MPKIASAQPAAGESLSVGQVLLRYLALEGVDHIFGIPGGALTIMMELVKNQRDRFKYVICRHETGAAYMADGYYRATGRPGVVMVTSGPGATNALTGTMNADNSGSAVFTLTGEVNEQFFGKGYLQEGLDARLDINAIYQAASAYSAVLVDQSDAQALIAQSLRNAMSIPRRAAHLSMPNNVMGETMSSVYIPADPAVYRATPQGVPHKQVHRALDMILAAKRPLILLGAGCREAFRDRGSGALLVDFVERYGIPVMTTADGKGVFPEKHDLSLRVYGIADCMWPQFWLQQAPGSPPYDALLVLGSSLGELSTNMWHPMLMPQGPFIQVDLDQRVIGRAFDVALGIVAEVGAFVEVLSEMSARCPPDAAAVEERKALVARIKKTQSPFIDPGQYASDASPIEPAALVRVLQQSLTDDAMILIDAGNCVGWSAHYFAIDPPQEIHSCLSMGPMGFAVGAVVGAKIGAPQRTCLALVGDGAFMMHGAEVSTASRYKVGAIWIVLCDDNLNMVSQGEAFFFPDKQDPDIWTELYALGNTNLELFAKSMGADAYRVDSPREMQRIMPIAINLANTEGRPQVVIAHIDRKSIPPYYNPQYLPPRPPAPPSPPTIGKGTES